MSPEDRTLLAASDHYARRLRELADRRAYLLANGIAPDPTDSAARLIDRARAAELRDPQPSPTDHWGR